MTYEHKVGKGNVTNLIYQLEVKGQSLFQTALIDNLSGNDVFATLRHFTQKCNASDYSLLQTSIGRTILNSASSELMQFRMSNDNQMTLTADSNFGVNTENSNHELDRNGPTRLDTALIGRGGNDNKDYMMLLHEVHKNT